MKRVGLSGASIAITFSLLGHAGIALVAARHVLTGVSSPLAATPAEAPATEFALDELAEVAELPAKEPVSVTASTPVREPVARAAVAVAVAVAKSEAPATTPEPAAAPASLAVETNVPHFAMTVAPAIGRVGNVGVSASPAPGRGETFGLAGISTSSSAAQIGDAPARLRAGTVPAYTPAALSASVEANVPLEIVVSESGAVTSARALEHVGYGLDEAAQQSILGYRFTPAMRNGKAIAVRMRWLMRFQLR